MRIHWSFAIHMQYTFVADAVCIVCLFLFIFFNNCSRIPHSSTRRCQLYYTKLDSFECHPIGVCMYTFWLLQWALPWFKQLLIWYTLTFGMWYIAICCSIQNTWHNMYGVQCTQASKHNSNVASYQFSKKFTHTQYTRYICKTQQIFR